MLYVFHLTKKLNLKFIYMTNLPAYEVDQPIKLYRLKMTFVGMAIVTESLKSECASLFLPFFIFP